MKNLKRKLLFTITFIAMLILSNKVYAANATLSPSNTSVTTGKTINITVGVQATEAWNLKLTASGGNLGGTVTAADSAGSEVTQNVMNATFSASTAGSYTVTLSGEITGSDLVKKPINISRIYTVTAPVQNNPSPKPSPVAPTFSNVNETVYATSLVNVRSSYTTSSSKLGQLQTGESVTRTGVGSNGWSRVTYKGQTAYINSSYLTKTKPETPTAQPSTKPSTAPSPTPDAKSNDATLKSLSIKGVELAPTADSDVVRYTGSVGEDVTEVEVIAEVNNEKAKVEITGNTNLKIGENTITIIVTAEDGTTKNYEIKLTRGTIEKPLIAVMGIKENGEKVELLLQNPTIVSDGIIEYTINLTEWLKSIEILENGNDENIVYTGTGTYDLVSGENSYITIVRVPQEGAQEKSTQYTLKINNPEKVVPVVEENKIDYKLIAIVAGGVILVLAIIFAIVHHRKSTELEYGNTDYSFLKNDEDIQNKEKDRKKEFLDGFSNNDDDRRKGGKHF